jgi:hypothetical protein
VFAMMTAGRVHGESSGVDCRTSSVFAMMTNWQSVLVISQTNFNLSLIQPMTSKSRIHLAIDLFYCGLNRVTLIYSGF